MKTLSITIASYFVCSAILLYGYDLLTVHFCATKGAAPLLTGAKIKCEVVKP